MASSRAEPAPTGFRAILWERVSAREEAGTVTPPLTHGTTAVGAGSAREEAGTDTPILAPTLAYWLSRSSGAQRDEEVR